MATLKVDELNIVNGEVATSPKKKSIPYDEYFGAMGLTTKQIQDRIDLANSLEEVMYFLYELKAEGVSKDVAKTEIQTEILTSIKSDADEYTQELAQKYASDLVDSTYKYDGTYYTSDDRAKFCAEDMSNSFENYSDYLDAVSNKNTKTWHTCEDLKVRPTHEEVDKTTIPIEDTFKVGGYLMRFPKDSYYGADDSEIVNCRCFVTYN